MKLKIDNIFLYCLGTYIVSSFFDLKKNNTTSNFLSSERKINNEIDSKDELFFSSDYEYYDNPIFSYDLKDSEYYLYSNEFLICKISCESPYKLKLNSRRFNKTFILKHENISDIETKLTLNYNFDFLERSFFKTENIIFNFKLIKDEVNNIKIIMENNKDTQLIFDRFDKIRNMKEYLNYKNFIIEFNKK